MLTTNAHLAVAPPAFGGQACCQRAMNRLAQQLHERECQIGTPRCHNASRLQFANDGGDKLGSTGWTTNVIAVGVTNESDDHVVQFNAFALGPGDKQLITIDLKTKIFSDG